MNKIKSALVFFVFGAAAYSIIEIIWRGYTHWTMALLGGIVMVSLSIIDNLFGKAPLFFKCVVGAGVITVLELLTGLIVNRQFGLGVWSYNESQYNILGQICPLYTFFWFLLCIAAFIIIKAIKKRILHQDDDKSESSGNSGGKNAGRTDNVFVLHQK